MRLLSIWRVVLLRLGSKYPFLKIRFQPGGAGRKLEQLLVELRTKKHRAADRPLQLSFSTSLIFKNQKAIGIMPEFLTLWFWRRREGVEPSGDLTTPRLVLKTSGTTGHLPSPLVKSSTCALLTLAIGALCTILVSTIFCPCPESRRNVLFLQVEISLVHHDARVT